MIWVMDTHAPLLREIKTFLAHTGMGPSSFGKRATGNSELVRRLEAGRTITIRTADKVKSFISKYPRARKKPRDRVR